MRPTRTIALEEHFTTSDFALTGPVELLDIGERRIAEMDRQGIDLQVLSLTGPGIQGIADTATAIEVARKTNDALAKAIVRHSNRLAGFACLPTQDPLAAASELERCVRMGFKGALIHAHTHGRYLDEESFLPLWERTQALGVPLYLHPADPFVPWHAIKDHPELSRAAWAWSAETGAHVLRIVCAGVFDRFPNAMMIVGHMGEMIPYGLWRIDDRLSNYLSKRGLDKASEYIKRNVLVTTSGLFDDVSLMCAINALGVNSIMFSVDYPYQRNADAMNWLGRLPLPPNEIEAIAHGNAERFFKL